MNKQYPKLQKQIGLVGAICGSLLIGLPALAMPRMENHNQLSQNSLLNPRPSIFNEPPYNRAGASNSNTDTNPSSSPMMQPMPEAGTDSSSQIRQSRDRVKPLNTQNQPATIESPSLQRQNTGDSQHQPGDTSNQNQSGGTYQRDQNQSGGAYQPRQRRLRGNQGNRTQPTNLPATNVSPYLRQQGPSVADPIAPGQR